MKAYNSQFLILEYKPLSMSKSVELIKYFQSEKVHRFHFSHFPSRKRPSGVTVEQLSRMFRLALHFQGVGNATQEEYDKLHDILQENRISVMNLTQTLVPSCKDLLERCMWKGIQMRCESLFQSINSTEGVCCSFNYYGLATSNFPL